MFPKEFGRYIEIFGGSGAVLLGKEPSKFEVYNDIEGELVNFFRVVKNRPAELLLELDLLPLNSREEFATLQTALTVMPDLEIICTDSCECFDANKAYLRQREREESNACVRRLLHQDGEMLTELQAEMSTARQFVFLRRCSGLKPEQVLSLVNETHKQLAGAGFEVQRMKKPDIKRFLAIYFGASMDGDRMPDVDGAQYVKGVRAK